MRVTFDFSPYNLNYNERVVQMDAVPRVGERVVFQEWPDKELKVFQVCYEINRTDVERKSVASVRVYLIGV